MQPKYKVFWYNSVEETSHLSGGLTPLHYCCQTGYSSCLELLLGSVGIELNAKTEDNVVYLGQSLPVYSTGGRTPLFFAVENGGSNCFGFGCCGLS